MLGYSGRITGTFGISCLAVAQAWLEGEGGGGAKKNSQPFITGQAADLFC